jgi:F-type H+-transporting ATPase subunit epsilon
MSHFPLQIITPEGNVWEGEADGVSASGVTGSFGVLANHAPMISALKPGPLTVRGNGETKYYAASEGTLEVRTDRRVVLLVDYAEPFDTEDEARTKAKELLDLL